MFLENSRYNKQPTMTVKLADGSSVSAVQPRTLPEETGVATALNRNDRLDIMALRLYEDGTKFWHIADANTELDSRLLTDPVTANSDAPPVQTILIPQK